MNPVKVSIIIPVYNVEKYLRECLDSCLSQTLRDIEIIAVNDGSPDNSLAILREYEAKDSRIKVIDKQNEGVGKARNDGIRAATGEFIAFMDSDDFYPCDNALETLYCAAKENDVPVAGGRKVFLLPDGTFEHQPADFADKSLEYRQNGLCFYRDFQYDYGYWQYIYDRAMLVQNDIFFPPYRRFQDPPFFVKAMITAGKFFFCDVESYCYRQVPSAAKYSASKTVDFLCGLRDNLNMSRGAGLAKLHYLSALRLNEDASFMSIQNIPSPEFPLVISEFVRTMNVVDAGWLRENGYDLPEPFVPELFTHMTDVCIKYENLRNNKVLKTAAKILKR